VSIKDQRQSFVWQQVSTSETESKNLLFDSLLSILLKTYATILQ